jgi:flagellum-specific ATP synthase
VGDACRGILDGHIWLSRDLAVQNHYPAVSILDSISRLMTTVADEQHKAAAGLVKSLMATYKQSEELINIGAYARGSNARIDLAIEMMDDVRAFLRQGMTDRSTFSEARSALLTIAEKARARAAHSGSAKADARGGREIL